MAKTIQGWVEISSFHNKEDVDSDYGWIGLIDISSVIQFTDEITSLLFGNPNDFLNPNPQIIPIAKNRGLPKNPCWQLRKEIEDEKNYEPNSSFGYTYIMHEEIQCIDFEKHLNMNIEESDWLILFKMIDVFKERKINPIDTIRLSIWYTQ
ncbi:hypothetical protein WAF17_22155 [Bernardetia sp. ABR2-2B]|uniref:hypothetical protein n=1 Tax=Bernardetia sp. ABR2-2B TaxID=3127472 RepID=UPI0030D00732